MTGSYPEPSTRRIDKDTNVVMRDDVEGPYKDMENDTSLLAEKTLGTTTSRESTAERTLAGMVPEVLNTLQDEALYVILAELME